MTFTLVVNKVKAINAISLDSAPFTDDMVHESARHALEQRKKYAHWLDSDDELIVANAMLIIIGRALNMLKSQIEAQGTAFEETGGFNERLTAVRIEAREKNREPSAPARLRRGQTWFSVFRASLVSSNVMIF